jgi:GNAT superfamily N-acetyltransferase
MFIRAATPADAAEIGRVHVASLRSSHVGLLPDQFLLNLSAENRAEVWQRVLTERTQTHFIFVAENLDRIVGFCACGPEVSGRLDYPNEVYTLYVLADMHGHGAGRALLIHAFDQFKDRGAEKVMLWVLRENEAARGFYEHMGGVEFDQKQEMFAGISTDQIAYGWELGLLA